MLLILQETGDVSKAFKNSIMDCIIVTILSKKYMKSQMYTDSKE